MHLPNEVHEFHGIRQTTSTYLPLSSGLLIQTWYSLLILFLEGKAAKSMFMDSNISHFGENRLVSHDGASILTTSGFDLYSEKGNKNTVSTEKKEVLLKSHFFFVESKK